MQKIGNVAYKLRLPDISKIHPVLRRFSCFSVQKGICGYSGGTFCPAQSTADLELVVEPKELLDVRQTQKGRHTQTEVLLEWKDLAPFEAT